MARMTDMGGRGADRRAGRHGSVGAVVTGANGRRLRDANIAGAGRDPTVICPVDCRNRITAINVSAIGLLEVQTG